MKSLTRLRFWIALALGVAAAVVAYQWPPSPRAVMQHDHICWDFTFSRDGTKLALLDREAGLNPSAQVLVWDVKTGRLLHRMDIGGRLYPSKVFFAPDDQSLGVVDAGAVTKWDLNTGRMVAHHDHAAWSHDPDHYPGREVLFSPTGRWLAHDVLEGRVYDVETGRVVHDYHERWPDRNRSAHGGCVAALVNGEVKTFDVLTGAEVGTFPTAVNRGTMGRAALTFSADGTRVVYFGSAGRWVVYSAVTGRECVLGIEADNIYDCHLSADKRFLAVSLSTPPRNALDALRLRLLATGRRVRIFDTTTGAELCHPIRGGFKCRFAPDGKTLAVADRDQGVAIWDWPLPSRWPLALAVGALTMMLSYGIGFWWSRRRSAKADAGRLKCKVT